MNEKKQKHINLSMKAENILSQIDANTKLGDLRKSQRK